jgi:hypothetical protein
VKHASITLVLLAFSLSGLFAACASGSETNVVGGTGTGGSGGTGSAGKTTTVGTTTGGGGMTTGSPTATTTVGGGGQCVPKCMSDGDCQGSCPAPSAGASNCCDTQTNICYVSNNPQCPANNGTTGATTSSGSGMYP